uniref:DUF4220 domain-containing protein n=1 Tax=Setaria digitata TaxID=48799 RepID=A0A915Q2F6_9BILA
MDCVWYSQTMLTFIGMRTPLYLLCGVYHTLFYTSYIIVKKLRLNWWGEAAANGLFVILLSLPLQVMGTKLLWWQWRSGDPRLMNTFYSVPLAVLAWYAILGTSFSASLYLFRKGFLREQYDWRRFIAEFFCAVGAALFALCISALQHMIFFHLLQYFFQISSSLSIVLLFIIYAVTVLKALLGTKAEYDLYSRVEKDQLMELPLNERHTNALGEISGVVSIHLLLHMLLAVFSFPEKVVSEGIHQAIGPCDKMEQIFSPFGLVLYRKKYFCIEEQHQQNLFDFHCIPDRQLPTAANGELEYYAICGTDFENRMEYITFIWYGFISPEELCSFKKKSKNGEDSNQAADEITTLRFRSNKLNPDGKRSRLPTPTRLPGYLSKPST